MEKISLVKKKEFLLNLGEIKHGNFIYTHDSSGELLLSLIMKSVEDKYFKLKKQFTKELISIMAGKK